MTSLMPADRSAPDSAPDRRRHVSLRQLVGAAVLALMWPALAPAADLITVYDRAQEVDPDLRRAEAEFRATLENRAIVGSAFLPQIDAEGNVGLFYSDPDGLPSQDGSSWRLGLTLNQLIFDRRRNIERGQTELAIAAAGAQLEGAREDLILRVAEAYFDILVAQETLAFRDAEVEAIERQLDQTQRRFEVGLIAITDVREAEAQADIARAEAVAARNALDLARESLAAITDEFYDELNGLGESLDPVLPDPTDAQAWVDAALENNRLLAAQRLETEARREDIALARAERLPRVGLNASITESGFGSVNNGGGAGGGGRIDSTDAQIGIGVNIPLYTGGRVPAITRQSRENFTAATEGLERAQRRTIQDTRSAYLTVVSNASRVRALEQALVSTRAAFDAASAGFEVGTRTQVDVLLALREVFRAERDYAEVRYRYLFDRLRLQAAVGALDRSQLETINALLVASDSRATRLEALGARARDGSAR